ncbi:MAG: SEC-C metal-binding domain-containing protein, partial [Rhodanobacteraceae bacterium]
LEFDDTANDQRKVIYEQRRELLEADTVADTVADIRGDVFESMAAQYIPHDSVDEQWQLAELERALESDYGLRVDLQRWVETADDADAAAIHRRVAEAAEAMFADKERQVGPEVMRALEKHVMLSVLDNAWKEHLASMDYLRQGIYLRSYAQVQPKQEYKRESFLLFQGMLSRIKSELVQTLSRVRIRSEEEVAAMEAQQQQMAARAARAMQFQHAETSGFGAAPADANAAAQAGAQAGSAATATATPVMREGPKIGRNEPCPCGSGKKYKHCHGALS